MNTFPSALRILVVLIPIASTVPLQPSIDIRSPTANWSSNSINIPVIISCTRLCAPKAIATLPTPATAMNDIIFMPNTLKI